MKKWLVTGSSGFLGVNAGYWLRDKVKTIGHVRTPVDHPFFDEQVAFDLRDLKKLESSIRSIRPDVILNTAATSSHETCQNDPDQAKAVNINAVRVMSEVSAEMGIRLIHISTDAVFQGDAGGYKESDEPNPFSLYGETKLAGEHEVSISQADSLIVRTNFYGWSPSNRRSILEFFVNQLREKETVSGYPDFIVTSMYVQTLIRSIWDLNSRGVGGLIHVASSDALSKYEFGQTVAKVFNLNPKLIQPIGAASAGHSTSRSRDLSLNTELLARHLLESVETQFQGITKANSEEISVGELLRTNEN